MITGLLTLFFSIATMMMAFCAGLFICYLENHGYHSYHLPRYCYGHPIRFMQFPILFDMIKSNIWTKYLNRTNCQLVERKEDAPVFTRK
ncbi:hypothetical protein SLA2020_441670 [Shorea laevis]